MSVQDQYLGPWVSNDAKELYKQFVKLCKGHTAYNIELAVSCLTESLKSRSIFSPHPRLWGEEESQDTSQAD